jgi:5-methylcytosine-specific restriction endonuclease McrA
MGKRQTLQQIQHSASRKALVKKSKGRCAYCNRLIGLKREGKRQRMTIDHIVPRSKGGTNTADNLVASCRDCNFKKGDKMPDEFLAA